MLTQAVTVNNTEIIQFVNIEHITKTLENTFPKKNEI